MRKTLLLCSMLAITMPLSQYAFGLEVPLKFERAPANLQHGDFREFFPFGRGECRFSDEMPAGDWKLPPFRAAKPLYALLALGDRKHLMALDTKEAEEKKFSRLWFDRDGDGDLAGERPVDGRVFEEKRRNVYIVSFPDIDATVRVDGADLPYSFRPNLNGPLSGAMIYGMKVRFSYLVSCSYIGVLSMGGEQFRIQLSDTNGNGRFTDTARIMDYQPPADQHQVYPAGDYFYLTDGKVLSPYDASPMGDVLWIKGIPWDLKIDPSAGKAILTEMQTGLSPLKLGTKTERLILYTEDGKRFLTIFKPESGRIMLPPGDYRLCFYQTFRKDAQGDLWRLRANGTNKSPAVTVGPDAEPLLAFGEPFTLPVTPVRLSHCSSASLSLRMNIEGSGREFLSELSRIEGTGTQIPLSDKAGRLDRPKEPSYTIIRSDGEIVARGAFEYG